MDEERVREFLSRYRPVGPDPGLRERVLAPFGRTPRTWPWAAAAAALIAATVGFHMATDRAVERGGPASADAVERLTAALGGGEEAVTAARVIVLEQSLRTRLTDSDMASETLEELSNGSN